MFQKILFTLLLGILMPTLLWAQPNMLWTRTYSLATPRSLSDCIETSDGGFLLAVTVQIDVTDYRLLLLKTNADGDSLWSRTFAGMEWFSRSTIRPTADGGYAVIGSDANDPMSAFFLMKVSATGDSLWSRTLGEGYAPVVLERTTNNNYLTACYGTLLDFNNLALLMRLDADGNILWSDTLTGNNIMPQFVTEQSDGHILCVSQILSESGGIQAFDLCAVECSANGDSLWSHCAGAGDFNHSCEEVLKMPDGNMIFTGGHWTCGSEGMGNPWIVRWNILGDTVGSTTYGADCDYLGYARDIIAAQSGGYVLTGMWDIVMLRIAENGDSLWSLSLNPQYYSGTKVVQLSDRSFVIAGMVNSWGNVFLMKTTPDPIPENADQPVILKPTSFSLSAFPNPFNPSTQIVFSLEKEQVITLRVFDVSGRIVMSLIDGKTAAGEHRMALDGSNLPSGVYFVRLETATKAQTKKLLLLK